MKLIILKWLLKKMIRFAATRFGESTESEICFVKADGSKAWWYPLSYSTDVIMNAMEYALSNYDEGEIRCNTPKFSFVIKHG